MSFNITFDYSYWVLLLCILLSAGYAFLLYYRNKEDISKRTSLILGVFRFIMIFIISVLILSPMIERLTNVEEDPIILFVQDNTGSVSFGPDSSYFINEYPDEVDFIKNKFEGRYDFRTYTFGESFSRNDEFTYDEQVTNMAEIFAGIQTNYNNRNVGAIIIASDGIYNRGINPVYASETNNFPLYTIALGDTVPKKDIILSDILHNRVTYLDNKFPVQAQIEAIECMGESTELVVRKDNNEVFSKKIDIRSNHHFETVDFMLRAEEPGLQRYSVELSPVEGEVNLENNSMDFFIEVLDSRQKVLILSNSPHPDVGAIKQSIEKNDRYEVSSFQINEFDKNVNKFNLVIFHQLPSNRHSLSEIMESLDEHSIPRLYVLGSQTNISTFNNLQTGITITPRSDNFNEVLPEFNQNFSLFSIDENTENFFKYLPPLHAKFAGYEMAGNVRTFLFQKIGNVVTDDPLVAFSDDRRQKNGVITGEGLWRWRLHNYMHEQNHNILNDFISKMVQYLSLMEDRDHLQVSSENVYYENEPVHFTAEVYNQSYELINEPELHITVINEEGVEYPYVFSRTANAYTLDAGTFAAGDYKYEAYVEVGDDKYTDKGKFSVAKLNIEKLQTIANHGLMYRLAKENDGKMFYPGEWEKLFDEITKRKDIRPLIYSQKSFKDAISLNWLFFLILLIVSLEWFLRRRSGLY